MVWNLSRTNPGQDILTLIRAAVTIRVDSVNFVLTWDRDIVIDYREWMCRLLQCPFHSDTQILQWLQRLQTTSSLPSWHSVSLSNSYLWESKGWRPVCDTAVPRGNPCPSRFPRKCFVSWVAWWQGKTLKMTGIHNMWRGWGKLQSSGVGSKCMA